MKVAISAQRGDLDALVDPRFGRARWMVIAETTCGEWTACDNGGGAGSCAGAGATAGSMVVARGAEAVITGNVGPNAYGILSAAAIPIHHAGNGIRVRDALAALEDGALPALTGPTVAGHWS